LYCSGAHSQDSSRFRNRIALHVYNVVVRHLSSTKSQHTCTQRNSECAAQKSISVLSAGSSRNFIVRAGWSGIAFRT
jgi:hypothetical protein